MGAVRSFVYMNKILTSLMIMMIYKKISGVLWQNLENQKSCQNEKMVDVTENWKLKIKKENKLQ